jgi:hypothetical protein
MLFTFRISAANYHHHVLTALSAAFQEDNQLIGTLGEGRNVLIRYELTALEASHLPLELCVFISLSEAYSRGFFNHWLLADKLSREGLEELAFHSQTELPDLWVLVRCGRPFLFRAQPASDDSLVYDEASLQALDDEKLRARLPGEESIRTALGNNQNDVPLFMQPSDWRSLLKDAP